MLENLLALTFFLCPYLAPTAKASDLKQLETVSSLEDVFVDRFFFIRKVQRQGNQV
jgi:hypothetical protein